MTKKIFISTMVLMLTVSFGQVSDADRSASGGFSLAKSNQSFSVPKLLNYQGYLTDDQGNPINNPSLSMTFAIYDASGAGNLKWTEDQTVGVSKGIFNVILGSVTPIPDTVFTGGINRWLELTAGGQTLSPRTRITAMGYAYTATYSDTAQYARNAAADNHWNFLISDGADTTLQMGGRWGLVRPGNTLFGNADSTHVNLGVGCVTGTSGQNYKYCTVGGGFQNTASSARAIVGGGYYNTAGNAAATVSGGEGNTASGSTATVSGGGMNTASNQYTTVSGGYGNTALENSATVSGGQDNTASGSGATVGGGMYNKARGQYSVVSGGGGANQADSNSAIGDYSAIGGGYRNIASGNTAVIGGGYSNSASSWYASVGGGLSNNASGSYGTVGGGQYNNASGSYATVGGGTSNTASNNSATVGGGQYNRARGQYSVVSGGGGPTPADSNSAIGDYSAVGGGASNTASGHLSTVAGGQNNTAADSFNFIGGGYLNRTAGKYSAILGGYADTITATGDYSYLFGINSNLTQDSTFMVDLPHIWFGTEAAGYEFPRSRGTNGQVMVTDGSGILSWGGITYVDSTRAAANAHKLQGKDTIDLNISYVNEGQVNSIANAMIQDAAVTMPKISQAGATAGQVIKWNGTAWQPSADSSMDNDWTYRITDGADTTLQMGGRWGIARFGNTLYGYADSTHVNLGVASTTGANGQNYKYITVGGGYSNTATYNWATVGGGDRNTAGLSYATVSGGALNNASGQAATVSGGSTNTASNECATVGGGNNNTASGYNAIVGGGQLNTASGYIGFVGGGRYNKARGQYSVVSGGGGATEADSNSAIGDCSAIGGGRHNTASGWGATIGGGLSNTASGIRATVGGGLQNTASGYMATVGGGYADTVAGDYSVAAGYTVRLTSAADYTFAFGRDFTTSTPNAVIFHNSVNPIRVGIGTAAPDTTLHVVGNIKMVDGNQGAGKVLTSDATGLGTWQSAPGDNDWTISGSNMYSAVSGNVGIGTTTPSAKLDIWNGNISVSNGGVLSNTGYWGDALRTNWGNDLTLTSSYANKGILFRTQSGEKMRIDADGYVGIGTTTPYGPLDILNGINGRGITVRGANDNNVIRLENNATGGRTYWLASTGGTSGTGQGKFAIVDEATLAERIVVTENGNVGIGTVSPAEKLDIAGTVQMTGFKMPTSPANGYVLTSDASGIGTWQAVPNAPVSSVFGRTGAVVAVSGDYTTTLVTEGTNLYFTNARAQAAITGGASTITTSNLTASRALVSDGSGKVAVSTITNTELGYLSGVTSAIQTQLNAKAPTASPTFTGNVTMPGIGIWNTSGNVGIGTTGPSRKLTIEEQTDNFPALSVRGASLNNTEWTGIELGGNQGFGAKGGILWERTASYERGKIHFANRSDAATGDVSKSDSKMVVDYTGNVGIGTETPAEKLDVAGTVQMTGFKMPTGATNGHILTSDASGIGTWQSAPGDNDWTISGNDQYSAVSGNVGIGTTSPQRTLHVSDVMRLEPRASAPTSPGEGDIYMDATTHKLMVHDGTIWQACW